MGAARKLPATDSPIPLDQAEFLWVTDTYTWRDVEPVLRLGGAEALSYRIDGLCDLLDPHEQLGEDETAFLKGTLRDLARQLFVGEDATPASIVVRRRAVEPKGDA